EMVEGRAADVCISGMSLKTVAKLAEGVPAFRNGGIGVYSENGFVHLDVRGHRARWGKVGREYVSIEEALRHA
ncbi:MAG: DUF882 domain-containing protein, partial [Deltaproteobacteria bacterium]|nr:DUF882 domain-containing protein [Deltaproteobacteria bacterium]